MPGSPLCGHTEGSCLPCHRRSWNPLGPDRRAAATRQAHHPLGCLRPIPDRIIFDELIQVLVFGCGCAGSPTPAARRPPCAAAATNGSAPGGRAAAPCGAGRLRPAVRPGVGAPGGGRLHHQGALRRADRGPSPVDRRKRGLKRSMVTEAGGVPLATLPAQPITATTGCWRRRWTPSPWSACYPNGQWCTWTPAMAGSAVDRVWPKAGWSARSPH